MEALQAQAGFDDRPGELVTAAWAKHHDELTAFLLRSTRDRDAAEDLLQETFLRLFRQTAAGGPPDNVRAWLYRVAGNLVVDRARRQASGHRCEASVRAGLTVSTGDEPVATLLQKEAAGDCLVALRGLTPRARRALLLTAEGCNGEELAKAIGCSGVAARTLLHRARTQARACFAA